MRREEEDAEDVSGDVIFIIVLVIISNWKMRIKKRNNIFFPLFIAFIYLFIFIVFVFFFFAAKFIQPSDCLNGVEYDICE